MKPNYTDITIILDRSGSMERIAEETITGFNKFLSDQRRLPGEMTLTLVQFNQQIEVTLDAQPIGEARPLDGRRYRPNGCTALLDAIGNSIDRTGARLRKMAERDRPSKVVVVILTDGLENASRAYSREQVFGMIRHQREKYSWEFVFLGANQDAIQEAAKFGIAADSALTYAATGASAEAAFAATSSLVQSLRQDPDAPVAFTDLDRQTQGQHLNPRFGQPNSSHTT